MLLNNEEVKKQVLGIFSGEIYRSLRGPEKEEKTDYNVVEYVDKDEKWKQAAERSIEVERLNVPKGKEKA